MKRDYLIAGLFFAAVSICTAQNAGYENGQAVPDSHPIELLASEITPLAAVLRIGMEHRIPLGVIMGAHPILCGEKRSFAIRALDFKDALYQAVAGTGYKVIFESDVYVLEPPDPTTHETKLLSYHFDRFSAKNSTMVDAGALLAGYIATVAEGAKGFAIDTLSSTSAEGINLEMQSATPREIADHIVTQKGKGVWVFRATPDVLPASGSETSIQIYGYKDNAGPLANLSCDADATGAK